MENIMELTQKILHPDFKINSTEGISLTSVWSEAVMNLDEDGLLLLSTKWGEIMRSYIKEEVK